MTWPRVQLRHVARLAYGDSLAAEQRVDGNVLVYGSNGPVGGHDLANTSGPTIVVGRKGSYGKLQFSERSVFAIDTTYFVDRRTTPHCLRWLYYALQTANLEDLSQDVGVPGLSREKAYAQRIPLPSLIEQQAIADLLDTEIARIDALIANKRRLINLLAERSDRQLDQLALPNLNPSSRSDPSDVPLEGEVPAGWTTRSLGHCLSRITYGFTNPMPTSDEGPLMLTANDIADGSIRVETARRTTQDAYLGRLTDKSRPKPGDILLTKDGTLGRVAVFNSADAACVNQSVAVLTPDCRSVEPQLLAHLLRVPAYRDALVFKAGGTTIKHLYISRVVKQRLGLPPRERQLELAQWLEDVHESRRRATDALVRSIELLQEHRQALIITAVTGEMGVPGVAA